MSSFICDIQPRKIFQPRRFYDLIPANVQKHALISILLNFLSFPLAQARIRLFCQVIKPVVDKFYRYHTKLSARNNVSFTSALELYDSQ